MTNRISSFVGAPQVNTTQVGGSSVVQPVKKRKEEETQSSPYQNFDRVEISAEGRAAVAGKMIAQSEQGVEYSPQGSSIDRAEQEQNDAMASLFGGY